ncbi:MAG: FHA domain-containing protein [Pseudomonadota bacterium]
MPSGTLRFQRNVYADSVRIGRSPDNEIVLPGDDVSRHHGCVEVCDGRLVYRDLDSRNGSYVMTRRVEEAVPLSIGSVIEIANFLLTIEQDPDLSQPGRFIEHAPTEVITGPSTRGAEVAGWSAAIDLLKVLRRDARQHAEGGIPTRVGGAARWITNGRSCSQPPCGCASSCRATGACRPSNSARTAASAR